MRLIDSDELQKLFNETTTSLLGKIENKDVEHFVRACIMTTQMIQDAPTIEVKPVKHGQWEWFEEWSESNTEHYAECEDCGWKCSVCDKSLADIVGGYWDDMNDIPKLNYCPYCGAKMEV